MAIFGQEAGLESQRFDKLVTTLNFFLNQQGGSLRDYATRTVTSNVFKEIYAKDVEAYQGSIKQVSPLSNLPLLDFQYEKGEAQPLKFGGQFVLSEEEERHNYFKKMSNNAMRLLQVARQQMEEDFIQTVLSDTDIPHVAVNSAKKWNKDDLAETDKPYRVLLNIISQLKSSKNRVYNPSVVAMPSTLYPYILSDQKLLTWYTQAGNTSMLQGDVPSIYKLKPFFTPYLTTSALLFPGKGSVAYKQNLGVMTATEITAGRDTTYKLWFEGKHYVEVPESIREITGVYAK